MLITIDNISYAIQGNVLIKDLSFIIEKNQVTSIIGYNGSGKSSLLKLLLGSISPDSGKITRDSNVNIGYVPQKLSFNQKLPITVNDFINIYNGKNADTCSFSCDFLDIQALGKKPLYGLSGGQLQRVLIYNALLGNPDVLFLDEPTAGLDIVAQEEFYALIEHIHKEHGISIVLVSHDIHTVYSKSDAIICLHKGVCCSGSPKDKKFSKQVSKLLGGYVIPYLHTHDHSHHG